MNDYYIYYPCPGTPGGIFYSNVGPAWTTLGNTIQFTANEPDKVPIGACYHVALFQSETVPLPYVNIDWNVTLGVMFSSCEECDAYTPIPPCQECPPGYTIVDGDCQLEQFLPATYTGGLLTVSPGFRAGGYNSFGLRLYPEVTGYTVPLIGNGVTNPGYSVIDNNGAGVAVPPLLGTWGSPLLSNLWGMYATGSCPATGSTGGRLNSVGIWTLPNNGINDYPPYDVPVCFEFCVTITEPKQYLIGISGDNKVEISINGTQIVFLDTPGGTVTIPFFFWHVFPYTFSTPGDYTIRLCGINVMNTSPVSPTVASFGAEIYDIDLATFQATLTTPASTSPSCGNVPLDLEPYILFSTRDYIGQQIADPENPGDWICPEGTILNECNGIPSCVLTITQPPLPCGYIFTPCCGGDQLFYQVSENIQLDEDSTYQINGTFQCYTIQPVPNNAGPLPYAVISISQLTVIDNGCEDPVCTLPCNPCTCTRIRWTGTIGPGTQAVSYLDCDLQVQVINILRNGTWSDKICLKAIISECVSPAECWETEQFGSCLLDEQTSTYNCPPCYQLEDCNGIAEPIYTLNPIIQTYIDANQVVQIDGSDICWIPSISTNDCSCAISVSVQFAYSNCASCRSPKGYKLTECTTGDIIYTRTDLSDYTTVIIEIDCGGCWTVEELDFIPPTSQPVTVLSSHGNCEICNATFYVLEDCTGELDPIYTITDLSDYVNNVIRLKYCPDTCWEVSVTEPQSTYDNVYVDVEFVDCQECYLATFTCICQTITNNSPTKPLTASYIDCDGELQTITIPIGETSEKICLLYVPKYEDSVLTLYGNCIDNVCPPPPSPLVYRSVRPGYGTAACTTDYYENVVCHFSEWMYKDVLERRYGISNCCPDELMKWEIKKELLDLAVLVNPDYTCEPQANCGCPSPSSCGCGGYTPTRNITCNS
jgi:hypothetical protein